MLKILLCCFPANADCSSRHHFEWTVLSLAQKIIILVPPKELSLSQKGQLS